MNKKKDFINLLIVLFLILLVTEAFILPNAKAKLSLFLTAGALLFLLLKGRISNRILIPVGIIYGIVSTVLFVLFVF
ncbi:hypothetical protein MTO98_25455 [Mucilaginibacter sp. SMC90]|uniref:hypothetical protein n=1 Tax=Mucilaginibacter sp. SMC90 TaxID=2929803 RepID=UPI001FB2093A|nr:hypothetical protein [Mucilaginibacter sp. SMC90]UOE47762.1 hypothetical protein MTO98_25455 [Mucilaginibacter sp. SMC90]